MLNTRKSKNRELAEIDRHFSLQNWFLHLVKLHNTQAWRQTFAANDHFLANNATTYCALLMLESPKKGEFHLRIWEKNWKELKTQRKILEYSQLLLFLSTFRGSFYLVRC